MRTEECWCLCTVSYACARIINWIIECILCLIKSRCLWLKTTIQRSQHGSVVEVRGVWPWACKGGGAEVVAFTWGHRTTTAGVKPWWFPVWQVWRCTWGQGHGVYWTDVVWWLWHFWQNSLKAYGKLPGRCFRCYSCYYWLSHFVSECVVMNSNVHTY